MEEQREKAVPFKLAWKLDTWWTKSRMAVRGAVKSKEAHSVRGNKLSEEIEGKGIVTIS